MQNSTPHQNPLTIFATTNFRDKHVPFGIRREDRRAHVYVIGKTGTGKSTLLETFIKSDLHSGQGLALLDPHGDLIEKILSYIPEKRGRDVIYFNVPDAAPTISFNPLEGVPQKYRLLAASGMLSAFKGVWADSWGPRLEHILRNALLALLDQEHANL